MHGLGKHWIEFLEISRVIFENLRFFSEIFVMTPVNYKEIARSVVVNVASLEVLGQSLDTELQFLSRTLSPKQNRSLMHCQ